MMLAGMCDVLAVKEAVIADPGLPLSLRLY